MNWKKEFEWFMKQNRAWSVFIKNFKAEPRNKQYHSKILSIGYPGSNNPLLTKYFEDNDPCDYLAGAFIWSPEEFNFWDILQNKWDTHCRILTNNINEHSTTPQSTGATKGATFPD